MGFETEALRSIASAERLDHGENLSAVSLVFPKGERPGVEAVRTIAERTSNFVVSYDPSVSENGDTGWIELLANGLTFDVTGLVPGVSDYLPEQAHSYGLVNQSDFTGCEAITILPGPHLSGGGAMFPVLRCLAWLGALLSELPGVRAVAWHPARSYCEPTYFRTGVLRWIEGGVFPGLGLAAITPTSDGGLQSEGLALFIGQELVLSPELAVERAEGAKIALRLLNWLVENGRVTESASMMGPSGEILRLVPDTYKNIIRVTASS